MNSKGHDKYLVHPSSCEILIIPGYDGGENPRRNGDQKREPPPWIMVAQPTKRDKQPNSNIHKPFLRMIKLNFFCPSFGFGIE